MLLFFLTFVRRCVAYSYIIYRRSNGYFCIALTQFATNTTTKSASTPRTHAHTHPSPKIIPSQNPQILHHRPQAHKTRQGAHTTKHQKNRSATAYVTTTYKDTFAYNKSPNRATIPIRIRRIRASLPVNARVASVGRPLIPFGFTVHPLFPGSSNSALLLLAVCPTE